MKTCDDIYVHDRKGDVCVITGLIVSNNLNEVPGPSATYFGRFWIITCGLKTKEQTLLLLYSEVQEQPQSSAVQKHLSSLATCALLELVKFIIPIDFTDDIYQLLWNRYRFQCHQQTLSMGVILFRKHKLDPRWHSLRRGPELVCSYEKNTPRNFS